MTKLLFIGHASFRLMLNSGEVIYIDPFFDGDYSLQADLVLITHEHFDHNKTELVSLKSNGKILRAKDFIDGNNYKTIKLDYMTITATPAFNKNHNRGCVGYVIAADGLNLYFAGDTSETEYMASMSGIDYAFLPIDGIYNMGPEKAAICAEKIGARYCVPIHTAPPQDEYDEQAVARFNPKNKLVIKPGIEVTL